METPKYQVFAWIESSRHRNGTQYFWGLEYAGKNLFQALIVMMNCKTGHLKAQKVRLEWNT